MLLTTLISITNRYSNNYKVVMPSQCIIKTMEVLTTSTEIMAMVMTQSMMITNPIAMSLSLRSSLKKS